MFFFGDKCKRVSNGKKSIPEHHQYGDPANDRRFNSYPSALTDLISRERENSGAASFPVCPNIGNIMRYAII
ncbi:hypothetical protein DASC09_033090 [Saccharomycopsis crataegensis]|uniref:Uncharacterized protein n=1 Tax=Saccharomycopsis crataegensis TaxID=43959 RepID=A0AAV5QNG0_9ASCO|nr:hypothetical protein DASC09_033090 [Saccharomycopsis crataegensis]